ncbi:MAG: bifunctional pyr operon transcriptional regulator/uracil phosphoribosyltransferase PyrR [Deltaproteobacteria bacterium]|nr:bifunctional pyr operon transcriptional regulator/uracil phosphoribosyltransferase PyrR [Deltaproteobacteria bacterium]
MDRVAEILPYRASWHECNDNHFVQSAGAGGAVVERVVNKEPRQIMNEAEMDQAMAKIAREIHKAVGNQDIVLLGIRTRGVPIAEWIAKKFHQLTDKTLPVGVLDINLYRDDLSEVDHQPVVKQTELPVSIHGKGVILVDDVLFTGRTIRAALDAVTDFGRPRFMQLAVVIDRGFRELPIHADYIGKTIKTTLAENVKVSIKGVDGENVVVVKTQK